MEVYTLEELGKKLGLTPRTLREMIRKGELEASYVAKKYIVTEEGLNKLLENTKHQQKQATREKAKNRPKDI
jgi:excisionase family DNA binding protein